MVLLQLCAIAGVFGAILVQFWCNSGAILVQLQCNLHLRSGATCCDLGGLKISNAYRYWPGVEWKRDRAPRTTNQAGKNSRWKDAWRKLAQWPGRSDLALSRFPNFQHRLSHALNIPFLDGVVNGFLLKDNWATGTRNGTTMSCWRRRSRRAPATPARTVRKPGSKRPNASCARNCGGDAAKKRTCRDYPKGIKAKWRWRADCGKKRP
jgi:hypothetical protein